MARVNDIRYIGYCVKGLDAEKAFYADTWKLKPVSEENGIAYFAAEGSPHGYSIRLRHSEENHIDLFAWSAPNKQDVDAIATQVSEAGGKLISQPQPLSSKGGGYGFRFFDPIGFCHEVAAGYEMREARTLANGEPAPERISHIVLHAPNHKAYAAFFERALGFRVSDWLGDFMCFMRCNQWHHRLAILPGPPCLDHVAYDVPGVDAVMKGIARLKKAEIDLRWGPGRHTAGNNIFSYFTTPAGWAVEYTSDLVSVDEDTWQVKVHQPSPEIMDQWGIGVGGPKTMPESRADPALFNSPEV